LKYLYILILAVPIALVAHYTGGGSSLVFVTSALGIVPLAGLLGEATEELSSRTGPRVGGLLNATLGNVAEVIIVVFAIRAGLLELVKASIIGSILGNALLVLGFSVFLGGLKHGLQRFNRPQAGANGTMLVLAIIGLGVPSLFGHAIEVSDPAAVEKITLGVAIVLMVLYFLWLTFSLTSIPENREPHYPKPRWSTTVTVAVLVLSTLFIAWLAELLVGEVEQVVAGWGLSEFFLGIVLIPLIGNAAEHLVGVQAALKNNMDLSLSISIGSGLQIALVAAPLLVFLSLALGHPLTLVFNPFELIALAAAVLSVTLISLDGESNWLEGAELLAVYLILAVAFFYLPAQAHF
jgi:Ca2+:H+ antiporter